MKIKNTFFCIGICLFLVACAPEQGRTYQENQESIEQNTVAQEPIKSHYQRVEAFVEEMTLEEQIGQLFIVGIEGEDFTNEDKELLERYHVGGIILFDQNLQSPEQTQSLIADLQKESKVSLWIGVDEEGGRVSRISKNPAYYTRPFKAALDLKGDTTLAYTEAQRMGKLLSVLGINMNFAPVADIYNEPSNTVIGDRSYGRTSQEVTPMVIATSKGLREQGVFPVIKHFPGHGNTIQDSHHTLAYIEKPLEALKNEEWIPFEESIKEGVEAVMLGHLIVEEVDGDVPVSLSTKWGELLTSRYENVLWITDAMNMGAITTQYTPEESAHAFMKSGYDHFLMPEDLERSYETIYKGIRNGQIEKERLKQSVIKIISKKVTQNIMSLE